MATLLERPMAKFQVVLDLLTKNRTALGYGLVSLLTAGGERIFSTVVFQCPCSATLNLLYGLVFLLVPAMVLFILAFVLRARTWRLFTGCLSGSQPGTPTRWQGCMVYMEISAAALVAPLTWVAVALLGGTFYQCGASGIGWMVRYMCRGREDSCTTLLPKMPCLQNKEPGLMEVLQELRAHSQVGGWFLIAVIVIGLLICTSVSRCRSPVSFQQLKFWKIYLQEEKKIFTKEATEQANQLAMENVKCFFGNEKSTQHKIPNPEAWQKISSVYTFNKDAQYYSLLHKYINENNGSHDTKRGKDEVVTTFSFVDAQTLDDNDNL
ncbi:calcium homeostasis modulator protein 6 [Suncus etruscus]|uniref:calcium homeostasis modulator protein 6 n=1 Tax=Suncus etruscus TaxID=109475 RepID=UPI00210F3395|nr:calcium homeostasis modulator protein 6 [Suncus etruscus]